MSIKRNFSYNLILTISSILFPVITFPLISHIIGPVGVGKVQFINTFVQYFIMLAALGIPMYGVREVAKIKHDTSKLQQLATELFLLNICTSFLLGILYIGAVVAIPSLNVDLKYYLVASIMLFTGACNVEWLFSGLEQFKFIALRSVLVKLLSLILLVVFLKSAEDTIVYLWILVIASVVNNAWNIWAARSYFDIRKVKSAKFSHHWKPVIYIFSTIAAISVYAMLDTILLGFMKGYEAVGYYTAASRITKPAIPILTSLGAVLIPRISTAFQQKDMDTVATLASSSMKFVVLLGVPICVGIIVLAPELIILLCGEAFLPATFCMQMFACIVLIIGLSNVWAIQLLTPAGKDKYVTYSVVVGLCINLVLNYFLIPAYAHNGAVIANFVTELFVMFSFAFFAYKFFKIKLKWVPVLISVLVSLLFFPVCLLGKSIFGDRHLLTVLFTISISAILYFNVQLFVFKNEFLLKQWESFKPKLRNARK